MTRRARARPWLVLVVPLLVALAGRGAGELAARGGASAEQRLRRIGDRLQAEFGALLEAAAGAARLALDGPAPAAPDLPPELAARFEGAGALGPDGSFRSWTGTPAEPEPPRGAGEALGFRVRVEGLWTRLVVRSGPDATGRSAAA